MHYLVVFLSFIVFVGVQTRQFYYPFPAPYKDEFIPVAIQANQCLSPRCKNDGICVGSAYAYICQCPPGYDGPHCEDDVYCPPNSCMNGGSCLKEETFDGRPICKCPPGFTGQQCQITEGIEEHQGGKSYNYYRNGK